MPALKSRLPPQLRQSKNWYQLEEFCYTGNAKSAGKFCKSIETKLMSKQRSKKLPSQTMDKNPAAVALGRLGGLKGGKSRAAKLSKERRSEIAKIAVSKREELRKVKLSS